MAITIRPSNDPYVNDKVRAYFSRFGEKLGHEIMCKKRMRYLFNRWLQAENLTEGNRNNILKWLRDNNE